MAARTPGLVNADPLQVIRDAVIALRADLADALMPRQALSRVNEVFGLATDWSDIERIRSSPIATAPFDEVLTYATWINQGDRFSGGLIEQYVENGVLVQLFERLLVLNDREDARPPTAG